MEKTIVEKLNLQKYNKAAVLHHPEGEEWLGGLAAYDTELLSPGYDLIFAFALDMEAMQAIVGRVLSGDYLAKGGYLYVAYPKKGNKVYPTYIHRDQLFAGLGADEESGYIGASTLKFSRMVGMNDVFTVVGLKEEAKKSAASGKPSQRVDDYVALIPAIESDLQDRPQALAFYRTLTPGYRKDWARYVYSAVQEETRDNRREEMKEALEAGFKNITLYRNR
ncbi:YdeI/OmpD-associated family protein [Paenibacillus sp. NFR01]|uniref:YdeI/OmpD-associated family protein n=1 Tax=Paenibacillus sp. NFR01 TaxID=1566279 RepID=UPI0008D659E6|nr:YdeI/OmpD-associated family protein [Paenibacillus sp. NFR01]SEU10871.1 Bacteriocin-protection, YdeI or OmpD-Associated [Paenibacillus sp. NFR01]